jgi:hypothetical protein
MGAALARPGMDTRIWASVAKALGESHVDSKYGVFVDVQLMPTGERITARVPADYAGKGFGVYAKIHEGDDLALVIPSGDPCDGAVVVARLWSSAATPPQEAIDNPDEVMIIVEKDKNLRLKVSGEGLIELDGDKDITVKAGERVILDGDKVVAKSGTVRLGDENATEQLVLGTTFRTNQKTMDTDFLTYLTLLATALTTAGGDPVLASLCSTAATNLVTAGTQVTALATSVNTFESGAGSNNYLSQVTNTK